jgi:hypothetical protein
MIPTFTHLLHALLLLVRPGNCPANLRSAPGIRIRQLPRDSVRISYQCHSSLGWWSDTDSTRLIGCQRRIDSLTHYSIIDIYRLAILFSHQKFLMPFEASGPWTRDALLPSPVPLRALAGEDSLGWTSASCGGHGSSLILVDRGSRSRPQNPQQAR